MNEVSLTSRGSIWRRLYDTNVAAATAAFTTDGLQGRIRRVKPEDENLYTDSGDLKVLDIRNGSGPGGETPNAIQIVPFGRDTTNQTINFRVWGVDEGSGRDGSTDVKSWEPMLLAQFQATLSAAKAGAAGSLVNASDYYADTITLTYGAGQDVAIQSNAADIRMAWARLDIQGFQIIVIEIEEGTATEVNLLYRWLF